MRSMLPRERAADKPRTVAGHGGALCLVAAGALAKCSEGEVSNGLGVLESSVTGALRDAARIQSVATGKTRPFVDVM